MTKFCGKPSRYISFSYREVAGYFSSLHHGFDEIGIQNHIFFERNHHFYNYCNNSYSWENLIRKLHNLAENYRLIPLKAFFYSLITIIKVIFFSIYFVRFEVFIYAANYNYLPFSIDQFILRLFRKKVVILTLGSDARPPYLNGGFKRFALQKIYKQTKKKYNHLQRKYSNADFIIDHYSVTHFNHKQKYIPFLYMGFPFTLKKDYRLPSDVPANNLTPLVLHAPSNPEIKGTSIIREAVKELKESGYKFDYQELINVPHEEVLNKLKICSFVINELYSDTLMAGLDTEAAWFGKPSIIGGYNLDGIEVSIKDYPAPPTYRIKPNKDELKKAIIDLLQNENVRKDLGQKAYDYVHNYWDAKEVAMRYVNLVNNEIPKKYFRNPKDDYDITGCGIPLNVRRKLISEYVSQYGAKALFLEHKSKLKEKLLKDCVENE